MQQHQKKTEFWSVLLTSAKLRCFCHDLKRAIHTRYRKNITELKQFCKMLTAVQVWCYT